MRFAVAECLTPNCGAKRQPAEVEARAATSAAQATAASEAAAEAGLPEAVLDASELGDAQAVASWLDGGGGVDACCAEQGNTTLLIAAAISSVMPLNPAQRASTPPPPSSHAATACVSPCPAARHILMAIVAVFGAIVTQDGGLQQAEGRHMNVIRCLK